MNTKLPFSLDFGKLILGSVTYMDILINKKITFPSVKSSKGAYVKYISINVTIQAFVNIMHQELQNWVLMQREEAKKKKKPAILQHIIPFAHEYQE